MLTEAEATTGFDGVPTPSFVERLHQWGTSERPWACFDGVPTPSFVERCARP